MERVFNKKRLSNRDNLILTCFSVYCFVGILLLSVLTKISIVEKFAKLIQFASLAVIGCFLIYDVYKRKLKIDWIMIALGVLSLLTLVFSRQTHILVFVAFIYALRNVKLKDIVEAGSKVMMLALFVITSSACLKLIPNALAFREGAVRYSLGFDHPTFPQYLMMMVTISNCYLFGTNMSYSALGLEALAAVCLNQLTNSRAGFAIVIIVVGVTALCKVLNKNIYKQKIDKIFSYKEVKIILIAAPLIIYTLSALCAILHSYGVDMIEWLDIRLSQRIFLMRFAVVNQKITLFGKEIVWNINGWYTGLDNAYFYLLYNRGIIVLWLFTTLYMYMIYKAIKNKDWWLLFLIMIILIDSFIDPILDDYKYNYFIFMISGLIMRNQPKTINCD